MRFTSSLLAGVLVLTLAGTGRAEPTSSLDVTRVAVGLSFLRAHGRDGNSADSSQDVLTGGAVALSVRAGWPDGGKLQFHAQGSALAGIGAIDDSEHSTAVGTSVGLGVTTRASDRVWVAGSLWTGVLAIREGSRSGGPWFGLELQVGQDVRHAHVHGWSLAVSRGVRIDERGWTSSTQVTLAVTVARL